MNARVLSLTHTHTHLLHRDSSEVNDLSYILSEAKSDGAISLALSASLALSFDLESDLIGPTASH